MPITPKKMCEGTLLTGSAATLYTVGATIKQAVVSEIRLVNVDSSARTFTVYVIKSGDTAADKNTIHKAVSVSAADSYKDSTCIVMGAGDFIQALADTPSKVTIFINGVEYT